MFLKFNNPIFHDGINSTVRRGVKWAIAEEGEFGHPILCTKEPFGDDGQRKIIGFASVTRTRVLRMCDILETMLSNEHDPACRTYHGLLFEMKKVYGDFDEHEIVTILDFEYCHTGKEYYHKLSTRKILRNMEEI